MGKKTYLSQQQLFSPPWCLKCMACTTQKLGYCHGSRIYVFILLCLRVVTCLIACQRCSGNLSADELISTVAPVCELSAAFIWFAFAVHVSDVVCSCQFVLSSSLSPVCFLLRTPAVLDRVSASQSPCLGDLLICLRPSSYSPCFISHCLSIKRHSTCNWVLSSHSLTERSDHRWIQQVPQN